jgi:hypothetical protein
VPKALHGRTQAGAAPTTDAVLTGCHGGSISPVPHVSIRRRSENLPPPAAYTGSESWRQALQDLAQEITLQRLSRSLRHSLVSLEIDTSTARADLYNGHALTVSFFDWAFDVFVGETTANDDADLGCSHRPVKLSIKGNKRIVVLKLGSRS